MSQTSLRGKVSTSKKAKTFSMALFAVIGDSFICKILKQVSHDYDLDYEEMKSRYCGESSFEKSVPSKKKTKKLVIDLEVAREPEAPEVEAPEVEAPEVEAPEPEPVTKKGGGRGSSKVVLKALSKMKKPELVQECERRDLDSEGTVAQLKERVKDAREAEGTAPVPKPAKKTKPPKKPKRQTKSYLYESMEYVKNQNKWEAAKKYADERGWKFIVLTENELGIKN